MPKKVEQINDHLFIGTFKSNNIKIGVNDMTVNDSEMSVRWKRQANIRIRIRNTIDETTACTIATSLIHFKID